MNQLNAVWLLWSCQLALDTTPRSLESFYGLPDAPPSGKPQPHTLAEFYSQTDPRHILSDAERDEILAKIEAAI